ncbi:ABC transporter permease [uncultured Amnibacterium sp.]|uniref:ABC transporter permease n=1 Tax=uncultured Amnibacterium sp. TaxID=1631851 RepID=UPI0035CC5260
MIKNLALRLLGSLVLLIVVPTVTFFVQAVVPTNIGRSVLGINASETAVNAYNRQLGLDKPLIGRYVDWLAGAVHGDFGVSYNNSEPVQAVLAPRLGVSLSLIVGALLVFTVVGLLLGILSATGNKIVGTVVDAVSTIGVAVPNFWLAVLLVAVLAVQLNVLPATGYVDPSFSPTLWLASLVLPVIALAFSGITAVAKQTRDQMLIAIESPYTRTLRANGASEFSLVYKHALRNAAGPVVTVLGIIFVGALSGSVIVENIFVLPGLGSQALQSTLQKDLPVIQGIAVYFTIVVVIVNVLIDVATAILNPKVRAA